MANAKRPSAPTPKDQNKEVHGNKAPFTPQSKEFASNAGHTGKGTVSTYLQGSEHCEKGTGDAKPVWP